MRNTIKKVMMVVPVLITNCQVSLKENKGPVMTQVRMIATAKTNVRGRPQKRDAVLANPEYQEFVLIRCVRMIKIDPYSWNRVFSFKHSHRISQWHFFLQLMQGDQHSLTLTALQLRL
ncbi:MAG: hypothetical protein RL117_256 [Verrucomicrobiota bacterium]